MARCSWVTSPTVKVDHQPLIGDAVVDGGPGLFLVVEKFPGVSTPRGDRGRRGGAGDAAARADRHHAPTPRVFRPADYVQEALDNVGLAVLRRRRLDAGRRCSRCGCHWRAVVVAVGHRAAVGGHRRRWCCSCWATDSTPRPRRAGGRGWPSWSMKRSPRPDHALRRLRRAARSSRNRTSRSPESVGASALASRTRRPLVYATLVVGAGRRAGRGAGRPARRLLRPAGHRVRRGRRRGHAGRDRPSPRR